MGEGERAATPLSSSHNQSLTFCVIIRALGRPSQSQRAAKHALLRQARCQFIQRAALIKVCFQGATRAFI